MGMKNTRIADGNDDYIMLWETIDGHRNHRYSDEVYKYTPEKLMQLQMES